MRSRPVAESPQLQAFKATDNKYKEHDEQLTTLSAELRTAQAAAKPLEGIKTLFWILIPVTVLLSHKINPLIALPAVIICIIVETVASHYFAKHSVMAAECKAHIEEQMKGLIRLEEGQLTPAKREMLKKHTKVCRYLQLDQFAPGITWEKAKAWLKKKYPGDSRMIEDAVMPRRVSYESLEHIAMRLKHLEERGTGRTAMIITGFLKRFENYCILTYRDAEEMVDLIAPEKIYLPSYSSFNTPKIRKLAINAISSMTFDEELSRFPNIRELVEEDAGGIK